MFVFTTFVSLVSETKPYRRVVSLQIVEMHVNMDCDGCEGKVRRALEKLEGAYMYVVARTCFMITHAMQIHQDCMLDCSILLFLQECTT